jgi:hypothetical protein
MLAGVFKELLTPIRGARWLGLAAALGAGVACAAQTPSQSADAVDASVGGVAVRLTAPSGQILGATALEPIYPLHDVAGTGVQPLAVYLSPETARFFAAREELLPAQGLVSTLIITEHELESRQVDRHALRDVLVDELKQQRQLQAFLASRRFGASGLRVTLPETRLLTVEDFLILEAAERVLPQSGRRISYCVEAFLALRNRPILASTCLTKPDIAAQDMYLLEQSVAAWAHRLLADNPSTGDAVRPPVEVRALRPTADPQQDRAAEALAAANLRAAAGHRRADVLVAATLLWAQLAPELRSALEASNRRFGRNVETACRRARDAAAGSQCELVALERRLRALEHCTTTSLSPLLEAESVEPAPTPRPNT